MESSSAAKGKAAAATFENYELPWCDSCVTLVQSSHNRTLRVEKYRPKVLDDVVGNHETIERLKVIARDGNCPHIIISVRFH
jgi:hypothetical protein